MAGSRMRADRMAIDYFRVCIMLRSAVVYYEKKHKKEYERNLANAEKDVAELKKDTAAISDLKSYYDLEGPEVFDPIIEELKEKRIKDASPKVSKLTTSVEKQINRPRAFCNAL